MAERSHRVERERHIRRVTCLVDAAGQLIEIVEQAGTINLVKPLVAGTSMLDLLHPDDVAKFQLIRDWSLSHPDQDIAIKLRFLRGREWWLPLIATVRAGQKGLVTACLELDDAVKARTEARQMRQVVEGSRQGILVRNLNKALYANNGYARLLGYTNVAELIAMPPAEVADEEIHPEDRERAVARIRACLDGGEPISHYEYRVMRRDGSYIWLEATAALVQWDDAPALLTWMLDISARKRVEAELVESREAAERASKAKSTFLASMSHELRTPLNAILGFSEMISTQLYGPLHAKYAEYATDIHRSGEHLLALINDILDMSKLEAGKFTLNEGNVGVAALVQDCLLLVRHRAQQAGLTIVEQVADDIPPVWADERALKQVILNFLSNAVKFTPRGGVVTIGAAFVAGIGVEIFVADTGIGMSEDGVRVATEPFGQIDSKIARENKGTGLGLPISIGLMQRHGGDISIVSAPNQGTRLTARLPIGRVTSAAA